MQFRSSSKCSQVGAIHTLYLYSAMSDMSLPTSSCGRRASAPTSQESWTDCNGGCPVAVAVHADGSRPDDSPKPSAHPPHCTVNCTAPGAVPSKRVPSAGYHANPRRVMWRGTVLLWISLRSRQVGAIHPLYLYSAMSDMSIPTLSCGGRACALTSQES
jgi:hypothetical protein